MMYMQCVMRLNLWLQARQELEKIRRKLEADLAELREQLMEKRLELEELQGLLSKREEEIQQSLQK